MKKLAIALILASSVASAEQVTVTGYGSTYDGALANAKMQALENVTGSFVVGETTYKDDKVSETIQQYNGGIIKRYHILRQNYDGKQYSIKIEADVEKKNNQVITKNNTDLDASVTEFEERRKVVDYLDDKEKALAITTGTPTYTVGRDTTIVSMDVEIKMQPKWVSDVQALTKVIDEEGSTSNNMYANAHAGIVSAFLSSNPVSAITFAVAASPSTPEPKDEMMVCFATRRDTFSDCKNVGVDFRNIPRYPRIIIFGYADGKRYNLYKQRIDIASYEYVYPGDKRHHWFFKSYNKKFNQPALIVYTDELHKMTAKFKVPTQLAKNMEVKVYLQ
jgi:hypothetical protein